MNIKMIGIDIAKNVFQVLAVDEKGNKVWEKQVKRKELLKTLAQLPICEVVMESCGSANHWSREIQKLGHTVKQIAPQHVKPYVKRNKNDSRDVRAIVTSARQPDTSFVMPKTIDQQNMQSLLRVREAYIETRTKLVNQVRGLLAEYGIVETKGVHKIMNKLPEIFARDAENGLPVMMKELMEQQYTMLLCINQRIDECDVQLKVFVKENEICQRIMRVKGVGVITAVAAYALVGNGQGFRNGRHFSAFLGLVPKQHSSGERTLFLGISKRGDSYLRQLLIHGGRAVVRVAPKKADRLSKWATQLAQKSGANRAAVAVANKNARIIMAMLLSGEAYREAA